MSAKGHPNNVPGVPMLFPAWLERVQIRYVNPLLKPVARYLPGTATITHRGRNSGTEYETLVTAYCKGPMLAIGLAHGKTDWVKNVLAAGEAEVRFTRREVHLHNPRILPAGSHTDAQAAALPRIARLLNRRVGVFVADIK